MTPDWSPDEPDAVTFDPLRPPVPDAVVAEPRELCNWCWEPAVTVCPNCNFPTCRWCLEHTRCQWP